ncbi:TonB family protein [Reyranella sp.]|uniref:TonB family protein n=1 Tax=Reyranella sp. TaxID=1929291 RepID=UPI0026012F6E|nr:TonB family protein [Reyranella sp.]
MSPEAMALAALLHALAALALWGLAAYRPTIVPQEDPIEITVERPKPPEPPPPPPPQQAQPKPVPPPVDGLKPPAEVEADKATQVRPSGEAPKDVAAPPPRSLDQAVPQPPSPPPPTETAMVAPNPPSPVPPPDRPPLQPFPKPTLGPTIGPPPPPRPKPPEPPPAVAHPQPQPRPAPPPPSVTPHQQPRPSPLVGPQSQQPPAVARRQDIPTAPSSPFVNPADERNRATAEQNYLWQVVARLRGYRYHVDAPVMEGLTVVMVTIARDGRLLSAEVVRSSGVAAMDQGVLSGIRQGSPYAPLPASISGPSARFRLPLVSLPEER